MRVPSEPVPCCLRCDKPMTMNLRTDDTFVQDRRWYKAVERYEKFCRVTFGVETLFLELEMGYNTP